MCEIKRKHSLIFCASMACSVLSSLSLLATVMANSEGENKAILVACALLFWIGFLLEQFFFWRANRLMRSAITKDRCHTLGKPGVISLSTYTEGFVIDVVFILSSIALMICILVGLGEALMQYVLICLVVLTFRLHCFLNGRNYKYKKTKEIKVDSKNG